MKLTPPGGAFPRGKGIRNRLAPVGLGAVLLIVVLVIAYQVGPFGHRSLPNFREISNVEERKVAFFAFLEPYVEDANVEILNQRERLDSISRRLGSSPLNKRDQRWIRRLAGVYGIDLEEEEPVDAELLDRLWARVDIIPPSLALAQAALESGWGTSRFARRGNNLFGIWCFTPGCGIVPVRRPAGATYEVKAYRSPRESFEDYLRNLNTNRSYESLWQLRESLREAGEPVTGSGLVDGLFRYSEEGWDYVRKVRRVIESNNLSTYDDKFL